MPDLKAVEKQIIQTEKFSVRIRDSKGGKARQRWPDYPFQKPADNEDTVRGWKARRFENHYPNCEVEVFYGDGRTVPDNVSLMSVRLSGLFEPSK
jgi:hypothetical protein